MEIKKEKDDQIGSFSCKDEYFVEGSSKLYKEIKQEVDDAVESHNENPNLTIKLEILEIIPEEEYGQRSTRKSRTIERLHCVYCRKEYALKRTLDSHVRNFHPGCPVDYDGGSVACCEICAKTADSAIDLASHAEIHRVQQLIERPKRNNKLSQNQQVYNKLSSSVCKKIKINRLQENQNQYQSIPKAKFKDKFYQCSLCCKNFLSKQYLQNHMVNHEKQGKEEKPKNKLFKCLFCQESFKFKTLIKSHLKSHTIDGTKKCELCSKRFKTTERLASHWSYHVDGLTLQCAHCDTKCLAKRKLKAHLEWHLRKGKKRQVYQLQKCSEDFRKFSCNFCSKTFSKRQNLLSHLLVHSLVPRKCLFCPKELLYKDHIKKHLMIHAGNGVRKCEMCSKSFWTLRDLVDHWCTHLTEQLLECAICGKKFKLKRDVKKHLLLVHKKEKTHSCRFCYKNFVSREELGEHQLTDHYGPIPFYCRICSKAFDQSLYRNRHEIYIHGKSTDTAHFTCDICFNSFKNEFYLTNHMQQMHDDLEPFQCSECPKQLLIKADMQEHVRMFHFNGKKNPISCYFCSSSYGDEISLQRHVSYFHIKNKKASCQICFQSFRTHTALVKHCLSHDVSEYFQCIICLKRFPTKRNLEQHNELHKKYESIDKKDSKDQNTTLSVIQCIKEEKTNEEVTAVKLEDKEEKTVINLVDSEEETEKPSKSRRELYYDMVKCPLCLEIFESKRFLNEHLEVMHRAEKTVQCNICTEVFHHEKFMQLHIQNVHTKTKNDPLKCLHCDKTFIHGTDVFDHMITHAMSPFECNFCSQTCTSAITLSKHWLTHMADLNLECNICWKKLSNQQNFNEHITTHSGIRQFDCSLCPVRFTTRRDALNHAKNHKINQRGKGRPFVCAICSMAFAKPLHLRKHHESLHQDIPCTKCPAGFRNKKNLIYHMRWHEIYDSDDKRKRKN